MGLNPKALARFNPTLVRLRPECPLPAATEFYKFQSHAGSIEAREGQGGSSLRPPGFQSHAGSIEARR